MVKKVFIRPYILRVNANPSPHLPLPGHPLPQGERGSRRLFMFMPYREQHIRAIALNWPPIPHLSLEIL
ncbi:hypothetical protein AGMMS50256_34930 [Betaproteobacteria bacterium]|nr:hypothetical protein AGMMS50256_34930 [Betaproteobacteria bacterium]